MNATATLIDAVLPGRRALHDTLLVLGTSLLIGLSANLAIPLPFTPVPLTLQTLVVLLAAAVLGLRKGLLAIGAYLLEGLVGVPVFAQGMVGPLAFVAPSGGYLAGFVAATAIVGFLAERGWDRTPVRAAAAMALGNVAIYAFGVAGLLMYLPVELAVAQGVVPFVVGDALKIATATATLPLLWKRLSR